MSAERVAIMGGGIGALATALALKRSGREVVIVERDPPPPDIAPEDAFDAWPRPGVPQFRHAHILLARVQTILRDHHPEVLEELHQVGIELSSLPDSLPIGHRAHLQTQPEDGDLLHLWGRRPTFEYVLRRRVGRLPNVRFIHDAKVVGLCTRPATEGPVVVCGVEIERQGQRETIEADLVVDASGKRSQSPQWLQALGVKIDVEDEPSGFVYACRHYRLKDPSASPPRREGGGNLDYLGYASFYGEQGHFALTFGCPTEEKELAALIGRPEGFEALCEQFPVLRTWRAASEARTKVLGAGRFANRWTYYGARGGRPLHGFFAVGDSHVETNPMYGRGCASAFVQAQVLSEELDASRDLAQRAAGYGRRTQAMLRPYFDISVSTDRIYHTRAKLRRRERVPFGARVLNYFYEYAFMRANEASLLVAREFLKAQQMREVSSLGTRLRMIGHIMRAWLGGMFSGSSPMAPVPPRAEFLARLPPPPSSDPPS